MPSNSIVQQLIGWVDNNRAGLKKSGIRLMESFPTDVDNCAGIGLEKDAVTIDFSVWEQTIFQVDYNVVGPLGEEVQTKHFSPAQPEEIEPVLDDIVRKLIEGSYIPTRSR